MAAMINCPYCGKLTDPKLENCPHCGGPMRAKAPAGQKRPASAPHHCPNCGSAVQDGDIICVRCGTNLLTGQKIADEQRPAPEPPRRRWPMVVSAVLIVVAVAIIGGLLYVLSNDAIEQALAFSQSGEDLKAINVLQAHVERHPNDAEAYLLLGKIYWKAQQYPNAAQAFQQASTKSPDKAEAAMFEVVALNRTANLQPADQVSALERLVEAEPGNSQARYLLGLAQGLSGNYSEQQQILETVSAGEGIDPQAMLGVAQALEKQAEAAQTALTQALSADPEDGDTAAALGFVAFQSGKVEEAVQRFQEALQKGSSIEMLVRTRLGMAFMSQGRYNEALPLLAAAKDHRSAAPEAPFYNALCLAAVGQTNEAIVELERLSGGTSELADEAATEIIHLHLRNGDAERAEQSLYKAQQSGQTSAKLYTLQGQIQAAKGQVSEAQQSFRQAIQADANYPAAHLEQGLLYVQREVVPDGIRELERYLELVPADAEDGRRNEIELLVNQLKQTVAE